MKRKERRRKKEKKKVSENNGQVRFHGSRLDKNQFPDVGEKRLDQKCEQKYYRITEQNGNIKGICLIRLN